jgi:spore coat polysaccharide biosynthesis protein SpsF
MLKENIVAFIVARLSSSRLPNKQLKKIGNKRLIDFTIENVKKSKFVEKIVIATTLCEENMPLDKIAKAHNIDIFFYDKDPNDVVGRLTQAAIAYNADIPILISGDCPLIWPNSLDKLIEKILSDKQLDTGFFCNKEKKEPIHEGMLVFRKKCLELADKISNEPNLREHQFPIIWLKPELFKTTCALDDDLFYALKHRISVDTLADLEFMNACFFELKKENKEFCLPNVVNLLIEKPEFMNINKDVHQISLYEKQKKALFLLRGKQNLDIFFELAYRLTKMGVGVRFFAPDFLKQLIEEKGFGLSNTKECFDFLIEDTGMEFANE